MFNKTDSVEKNNVNAKNNRKNKQSIHTTSSMKEKDKEQVKETQIKTTNNYAGNYTGNNLINYWRQLKLNTKALIFAVFVGTLPAIGLGAIAYSFGSKSISKQIISNQENEAMSLGDTIGRFMMAKYADIQVISKLPFLTNSQVSQSTSAAEKIAFFNNFVKTYRGYDHLAVFDLNGNIILQSRGGTSSQERNLPYFREVLQKNVPVISQPETLKNNVVVIYVAAPVKNIATGKTIAVVRSRVSVQLLTEAIKKSVDRNKDYYLVNREGKFFLSPQQDLQGQAATVIYPSLAQLLNQKDDSSTGVQTIYQTPQIVSYVPLTNQEYLPHLNWGVILVKDTATALIPQRQFLKLIANITALTALVMTVLTYWLAKRIVQQKSFESASVSTLVEKEIKTPLSNPIEDKLPIEEKAEKKDIDQESIAISEHDWQQKEGINSQILQLIHQLENHTKGDLKVKPEIQDGELSEITKVLNSLLASYQDIVTLTKENASQISSEIGTNQDHISYLTEEAIKQVEEINQVLVTVEKMTNSWQELANGTEEITAISHHTNQAATQSETVINLTVENIEVLQETVDATTKKVRHLGESSQQISRVVSLVNQIAIQTNLLAINAGIEAARAGEEGQGFAVIAEEVGELAARSTVAIQEIEQVVDNIKRDISEVLQAMEVGTNQVVESKQIVIDAKHSLSKLVDISQQIDAFSQSISHVSTVSITGSQAVSKLLQDMTIVLEKSRASSQQISDNLQKTAKISQQLEQKVDNLKFN